MYQFVDMVVIGVLCMAIGGAIGACFAGLCASSGLDHARDDWFEREKFYKEELLKKDAVIKEKSRFIARFRHKIIEVVQQYIPDDVAACTMIVATIKGIKEEDE